MAKALYGEGAIWRRRYIAKALYSEGAIWRRRYITKALYSERAIWRRRYIAKALGALGVPRRLPRRKLERFRTRRVAA